MTNEEFLEPEINVITDAADEAAEPAPARVRTAVLAAVRQRTALRHPPLPTEGPPAAAPFAAQVAELDALLTGLTPAQWMVSVLDGWDVGAILAHVFSVDALLAEALGVPVPAEAGTGSDIAARTESAQHAFSGRPSNEVYAAWRGQAIALLHHVTATPERLERLVSFAGLQLPVGGVLLDRAGETWIHTEDIRSALALPSRPPSADHVETLADAGAQLLPARWPELPQPATGTVWLRLLGIRTSDWLVDPAGSVHRPPDDTGPTDVDAVVTVDALEFCYLLGGRRNPDTIGHQSSGDPALVRATLAAAAGIARL